MECPVVRRFLRSVVDADHLSIAEHHIFGAVYVFHVDQIWRQTQHSGCYALLRFAAARRGLHCADAMSLTRDARFASAFSLGRSDSSLSCFAHCARFCRSAHRRGVLQCARPARRNSCRQACPLEIGAILEGKDPILRARLYSFFQRSIVPPRPDRCAKPECGGANMWDQGGSVETINSSILKADCVYRLQHAEFGCNSAA